MTLSETFTAARQRIAAGKVPMYAFIRYEQVSGAPFETRRRPLTFAELRAAYAEVIEGVRRIEDGARYRRMRSLIIDETPACRSLLRRIDALQDLPFGMSVASEAEPLLAEFEAVIAGRMAEEAVARRVAA